MKTPALPPTARRKVCALLRSARRELDNGHTSEAGESLDAALKLAAIPPPPRVHVSKHGQDLFVIPAGNGCWSCYGFKNCQDETAKLANELRRLDLLPLTADYGRMTGWRKLETLRGLALRRFKKTGERAKSGLHPQLVGLEGKRVEVVQFGETRRFQVGRSTGWIPCHLEIVNSRSSGGGGISPVAKFDSVRVL